MRRVIAVGAIVLAGIGGLVACGDDDDESQATAEQNLCGSLSTFSAAVVNLQGLDVQTASKDDYEAAVQGIEDAWNSVRQDAKDVADADADALDAAREDLQSAVDEAPEDVPVASAIAGLEPQVDQVAQAWRELFDGLDCASGTPQDESLQ
jgi:hypothetical protein